MLCTTLGEKPAVTLPYGRGVPGSRPGGTSVLPLR